MAEGLCAIFQMDAGSHLPLGRDSGSLTSGGGSRAQGGNYFEPNVNRSVGTSGLRRGSNVKVYVPTRRATFAVTGWDHHYRSLAEHG